MIKPCVGAIYESLRDGLWADRLKRFVHGGDLPLVDRYQRYLAAYNDDSFGAETERVEKEVYLNKVARGDSSKFDLASSKAGIFNFAWGLVARAAT